MNSERSDTILFQEYYINFKINLAKVEIQF